MMLGDFFFTATPCCCTIEGMTGMASCTRFCTSTWAMFRSVPSWKVTVSVYVPSLVHCDDM